LKVEIEMNELQNSPTCERAPDLIAFLYQETGERETRDFELHLTECRTCREEVASFGAARASIREWRDEALAGFVSTPVATQAKSKSALAALRQFFDLSPLWLKGATAFAAVTFCVLAALVLVRSNNQNVSSTTGNPAAVYTAQDVDRMIKEALAKQEKPTVATPANETLTVKTQPQPKSSTNSARPVHSDVAKSRRPLSRAEREQLAADLRLLSTPEDETLDLLGDRINR
jgi:hypothetical protein